MPEFGDIDFCDNFHGIQNHRYDYHIYDFV